MTIFGDALNLSDPSIGIDTNPSIPSALSPSACSGLKTKPVSMSKSGVSTTTEGIVLIKLPVSATVLITLPVSALPFSVALALPNTSSCSFRSEIFFPFLILKSCSPKAFLLSSSAHS